MQHFKKHCKARLQRFKQQNIFKKPTPTVDTFDQ